jgi:chemotaxis protein methyltransferase CheR
VSAAPDTKAAEALFKDFTDGEFPFTQADFHRIADILHAETGIALDQGKMPLVYSRLARRLRALGLKSFTAYHARISTHAGAGERRQMIEALTTNVTRFFREAHHFEHLATEVLPALVAEARAGGRVRLWSAGCSSGEEPYSMALTVLAQLPDAARYDIKILATDIDSQVLGRGQAGRYPSGAVARIDPALRERWMIPDEGPDGAPVWLVGDEMRALVGFRAANLLGEWPMKGPFQVIFCRNVVIYFDETLRDDVLAKMTALLSPGGHLYVGHSERLKPDGENLQFVGLSTYRRLAAAPATALHLGSIAHAPRR